MLSEQGRPDPNRLNKSELDRIRKDELDRYPEPRADRYLDGIRNQSARIGEPESGVNWKPVSGLDF